MRYRILKYQGICRNLIEKYAQIVKETRLYIIVEATPSDIELLRKQCSGISVIPEDEIGGIKLHFSYSLGDAVTIDEIKSLVGFNKLIDAGYTDKDIIISVIGTGCNIEQLPDNIKNRVTLLDFTGEGPQDDLNHDTYVIRIIGELCPNVKIRSTKVVASDRSITTRDMLDAVEDAYFESHIINCSWGFEGDQCTFYKWYHGLMNFVYYADPPLYFIASAGNEDGVSNAVTYPAADEYAIAVGATKKDGSIAEFSSRGPFICDGLNIPKPDVSTYGIIDIDGQVISGTSYASPVVTAFIAYLYNAESKKKGLNILSGHRINPKYGVEKWSNDYGYGVLSAFSGTMVGQKMYEVMQYGMPVLATGMGMVLGLSAVKAVIEAFNRMR
jgi:subtilisin family serine protease